MQQHDAVQRWSQSFSKVSVSPSATQSTQLIMITRAFCLIFVVQCSLLRTAPITNHVNGVTITGEQVTDEHVSMISAHQLVETVTRIRANPLPPDCWRKCLEYLSSPRDVGRFRLLSKRHHRIHDFMLMLTITDFRYVFNNHFANKRCRSSRNSERTIPLIPCGSMDLDDESHSIACLGNFHLISGKNIVRGLVCYSGYSFLSMFLRHDTVPANYILLICICALDRFDDVRLYRPISERDRDEMQYIHFNVDDLHRLLLREYITIDELDDTTVWTMENGGKRLRRRLSYQFIRLSGCLQTKTALKKFETWVLDNPHQFWIGYAFVSFIMFFVFTYAIARAIQ